MAEYTITIDGSDLSSSVRLKETRIKRSLGKIGTAHCTLLVTDDVDMSGFANLDTIIITDEDAAKVFSGYVVNVEYRNKGENVTEWHLECQDEAMLLDTVKVNEVWENKTDQVIIQDAFSALGDIDTSNVSSTQTLVKFEAKDITLMQLMKRLAAITGAMWFVNPESELWYDDSHFATADFGVDDASANMVPYSDDFSEWWAVRGTLAEDVEAAPPEHGGGTVVDKLTGTDANAYLAPKITSAPIPGISRYTYSYWVRMDAANSPRTVYAFVSCDDSGEHFSAPASVGTDWVRLSVTFSTSVADTVIQGHAFGQGSLNNGHIGYCCGAQLRPENTPADYAATSGTPKHHPYTLDKYRQDYTGRANRVICIGALDPDDGSEISVTVNDTGHQTTYGRVYSITLVDRSIIESGVLTLWANTELAERITPTETGALMVRRAGLDVGQGLPIVSSVHSIDDTYTIRELVIEQDTDDRPEGTRYTVTFGDRDQDLVELMQRFNRAAAESKMHQAIPPDGTIGDGKLARVTDPIQITNADVVSIAFAKVTSVSITNADIVSVAYSKITSVVVTDSDIANLTITESSIANLTITESKIANATLSSAKISDLAVSKITGWGGASIEINSSLTFTGSAAIVIPGARTIAINAGSKIQATSFALATHVCIAASWMAMDQYRDAAGISPAMIEKSGGIRYANIANYRSASGATTWISSAGVFAPQSLTVGGSTVLGSSKQVHLNRYWSQAAVPTLDNFELALHYDTDDSTLYLIAKVGANTFKAAMAAA